MMRSDAWCTSGTVNYCLFEIFQEKQRSIVYNASSVLDHELNILVIISKILSEWRRQYKKYSNVLESRELLFVM